MRQKYQGRNTKKYEDMKIKKTGKDKDEKKTNKIINK